MESLRDTDPNPLLGVRPDMWGPLKFLHMRPEQMLEHTRRLRKYTHTDLAEITGLPRTAYANLLCRLRNGGHVSIRLIARYFDAMQCNLVLIPVPKYPECETLADLNLDYPKTNKTAISRVEIARRIPKARRSGK